MMSMRAAHKASSTNSVRQHHEAKRKTEKQVLHSRLTTNQGRKFWNQRKGESTIKVEYHGDEQHQDKKVTREHEA